MSCYRRRYSRKPPPSASSPETVGQPTGSAQGAASPTYVPLGSIPPASHLSPSSSTLVVQTPGAQQRTDIYNGIVVILESIKEISDAFPPLKSAAAGLLILMNAQKVRISSWRFLSELNLRQSPAIGFHTKPERLVRVRTRDHLFFAHDRRAHSIVPRIHGDDPAHRFHQVRSSIIYGAYQADA